MDVRLAWWDGLALGTDRFERMTRSRRDPLLPQFSLPLAELFDGTGA